MIVAVIFVLGLCIGSFVNALVWRLHIRNQKKRANSASYSIFKGRSMCPKCEHALAVADLVPILSWLGLRGRCRYCHQPISLQYPLVELLTGASFGLSYLGWDFTRAASTVEFGGWLLQLTVLIALGVYDLKHMLLPDKLLKVLGALALASLLTASIVAADPWLIADHALAAFTGGGFFYALFAISKGRWMGGGDVKLAFIMGLILGLKMLLVAMMVAFNVAAILSLGLIAARLLKRKDLIPFGPFLIVGTLIAKLYGQSLINVYLRLVKIY